MSETMQDVASELVEYAVRLQLEIKEREAELAEIKTALKDNYEPGTHEFKDGKFYIKVSTNSRIDDKLAREHLSDEAYLFVSKSTIDPVLARRKLTEGTLAEITKHYDNKIEFGIN